MHGMSTVIGRAATTKSEVALQVAGNENLRFRSRSVTYTFHACGSLKFSGPDFTQGYLGYQDSVQANESREPDQSSVLKHDQVHGRVP